MIGNVFLLFLGVILQVNVLASHLTFQLNDSKAVSCTILCDVKHEVVVISPRGTAVSVGRLSPLLSSMEESPETENSLSFTFDYLKDIRYDEAANMLEIILRTDERICLHATEEPSKKQLKEIFGQIQSHRIQTKVDTEDDGGRTVVARKMATRDKLLVLPPPNRIRELPPKGANPRKPTTEWRNPLFSSPKAIQHMKGGSLAAASTNSGAEARDWTSEEGESVNCNRKSDEAPLRPKKRDSSSPSGRLPNEEGGFFSS